MDARLYPLVHRGQNVTRKVFKFGLDRFGVSGDIGHKRHETAVSGCVLEHAVDDPEHEQPFLRKAMNAFKGKGKRIRGRRLKADEIQSQGVTAGQLQINIVVHRRRIATGLPGHEIASELGLQHQFAPCDGGTGDMSDSIFYALDAVHDGHRQQY